MPRPRQRGAPIQRARTQTPNPEADVEERQAHDEQQQDEYEHPPSSSPPGSPPLVGNPNPTPQFYDTSFSTHRISSLHIGPKPLDREMLAIISSRLRDALVGDVVRGVQVAIGSGGGEAAALARSGTLEHVAMQWIGAEAMLRLIGGEERDGRDGDERKGIHIILQYEQVSYAALLLPHLGGDRRQKSFRDVDMMDWTARGPLASVGNEARQLERYGDMRGEFLDLPLLLLRMPAPLKAKVTEFLMGVFDARVSSLRMGTRSLVSLWEGWMRGSEAGREKGRLGSKDVVVTLRFGTPVDEAKAPGEEGEEDGRMEGVEYTEGGEEDGGADKPRTGLRTLDVLIPAGEMVKWYEMGERVSEEQRNMRRPDGRQNRGGRHWAGDSVTRRKLAGGKEEEGWAWREGSPAKNPFTEALAAYLDENMALDLFHPLVRVVKIACGGFVLTEERLKVFTPPRGSRMGTSSDKEESGVTFPEDVYRPVWSLMLELSRRAKGGDMESGLFKSTFG